jgi:hypothetical protein
MNLNEEQRASVVKAVREAAGKLRAVPRAHLEALCRESSHQDAEVARLALSLADAEHSRQVDVLSRAEGGPCRVSMLIDRTHAEAIEEDI